MYAHNKALLGILIHPEIHTKLYFHFEVLLEVLSSLPFSFTSNTFPFRGRRLYSFDSRDKPRS